MLFDWVYGMFSNDLAIDLGTATTLTFGFAETYWLLLVARVVQGLASAFSWTAGLAWRPPAVARRSTSYSTSPPRMRDRSANPKPRSRGCSPVRSPAGRGHFEEP